MVFQIDALGAPSRHFASRQPHCLYLTYHCLGTYPFLPVSTYLFLPTSTCLFLPTRYVSFLSATHQVPFSANQYVPFLPVSTYLFSTYLFCQSVRTFLANQHVPFLPASTYLFCQSGTCHSPGPSQGDTRLSSCACIIEAAEAGRCHSRDLICPHGR